MTICENLLYPWKFEEKRKCMMLYILPFQFARYTYIYRYVVCFKILNKFIYMYIFDDGERERTQMWNCTEVIVR